MKFLEPEMFWHLVWILPVMLALFLFAWYRRKKVITAITGKDKPDHLSVICSPGMRIFRFILLCLTVILLITALARPAWDYQTIDMAGSGRDLMVVFDTSKSMLSRDVQPSRMDHAKWLVKELVNLNPGDRFGLVAFAGSAFLECPLTVDRNSFLQHVSELDTESIPVGGTNIEEAISTALESFKAAEAIHRAIILVTDGDELTGDSNKVINELTEKKIPLFIVGIGDPSQPSIIQYKDEAGTIRILKDSAGKVVNSPLNEKQLISLAQQTGGIYVRSTAADTGLKAIENRIKKLNTAEYSNTTAQKPIERFHYPLWAALVILVVWMCLSERGRTKKALILILFAGLTFSAQAQTEKKMSAEELYNHGVKLQSGEITPETKDGQKADALAAAEEYYLKALASGPDRNLLGKIYQNLGVIYQKKGISSRDKADDNRKKQKLQEAVKDLDSVLEQLETAEKYYQEAMVSSGNVRGIVRNQTRLLKTRKETQKLKKDIEEFLKQEQKTRQQIQDAKNQQQKENQQKQDQQKQEQQKQDQQKQEQQKQDQQKQDQQKQDQQKQDQQKQSSAQEKTSQAKKSAEQMEQSAKNLGQKEKEQQANSAKKELEKAEQEQKKNNPEKAEEHLKKASEIMGKPEDQKKDDDKKDQKEEQEQDKGQKEKQGQDKDQKDQKDQKDEQGQPRPQSGKPEEKEGKIDRKQAGSILEQMADEEKDLRKKIKQRKMKNSRIVPVTKDW